MWDRVFDPVGKGDARRFSRPFGVPPVLDLTHGSRRGLYSCAPFAAAPACTVRSPLRLPREVLDSPEHNLETSLSYSESVQFRTRSGP